MDKALIRSKARAALQQHADGQLTDRGAVKALNEVVLLLLKHQDTDEAGGEAPGANVPSAEVRARE